MKDKPNILPAVLLFLFLGLMLLPLLQHQFSLLPETKLEGYAAPAPDTSWNAESWFNGTYAPAKEKYLNEHFGFRNWMIRFRNEVEFRAYDKVHARDVVLGKSGFLYELYYLEAHAGLDYVGDEKLKSRFEKLKLIQDSLEKRGIHFLILFAPGKASYYPEYIPAPYAVESKQTNYLRHVEYAGKYGIHYLDFNAWFLAMKSKTPYPLYPKTGTHWSVYGMHVAFDSVIRYLEHSLGRKMARFDYSHVVLSDSLRTPDGDIALGLNLFSELPHFTMAYPEVRWTDTAHIFKPRVMVVSDSYWMGIYYLLLPQVAFRQHEFWYYNSMLHNYDPEGKVGKVGDYDLKQKVEGNDVIILEATEATLSDLGWGFIDEVYRMYKNGPQAYAEQCKYRKKNSELNDIRRSIRSQHDWMQEIAKTASTRGISLDSALDENARYVYNQQHENDAAPVTNDPLPVKKQAATDSIALMKDIIQEMETGIRTDKDWLALIQKKADNFHISLDSAIHMDARWMAQEEFKKRWKEKGH